MSWFSVRNKTTGLYYKNCKWVEQGNVYTKRGPAVASISNRITSLVFFSSKDEKKYKEQLLELLDSEVVELGFIIKKSVPAIEAIGEKHKEKILNKLDPIDLVRYKNGKS
jgi:hypothetical protein